MAKKPRSMRGPKGPAVKKGRAKVPNATRAEHLPGSVWKRNTKSPTGRNSPYGAKNKAGETRYFKTPDSAKRFASE